MLKVQEYKKLRKKFDINYYEKNFKGELKESSFILFLQDVATLNAELNGFGPTFVFENGYAWFLIKYHIELKKYPKNCDFIEIETEPRGANRLFALRDFTIYSEDNEEIGRVASTWALINMQDKSMINLIKEIGFSQYEKRENDLQYNKIPQIENVNYEKTFEIRYDDIDINQHANNSTYITWALEALPYDFRSSHNIKTFDIVFKKESKLGANILSQVEIKDNTTIHKLLNKDTQEELCFVMAEWVED